MSSSRIFSGIQPSGELHIGNYLGAVKNWVALQHQYESFFCIVDYHAITVPYEPEDLRRRTRDMAMSLVASGIDPSACTLFVQSALPEFSIILFCRPLTSFYIRPTSFQSERIRFSTSSFHARLPGGGIRASRRD